MEEVFTWGKKINDTKEKKRKEINHKIQLQWAESFIWCEKQDNS